jgi:hypothetical protein
MTEEIKTEEITDVVVDVVAEDFSVDVDALFEGEELSEEYKTKAKSIFEAVIETRVKEKEAALVEEFETKLEEQSTEFSEALESKVDEYLEYVVSEWMEENKLAVERGIKSEMVEDFMVGLKTLFTEHYVDIPDEAVDVVEGFAIEVASLKTELDTAISEKVEVVAALNSMKKGAIAEELSADLSDVQIEKLKSLAENIEFVSEEDYKEKLVLTKQKYFSEGSDEEDVSIVNSLTEGTQGTITEEITPAMSRYLDSVSRSVKS